jgi:hypothetical protein
MSNIIINRDGDFKGETISSVPLGNNNFMINTNNSNLKKEDINNNIKPMLSGNSNTITINDGKKVKIKPILNKKVPSNTFSMMANSRKNINSDSSEDNSVSSGSSYESVSNDILSSNRNNQGGDNIRDDADDDDDVDDNDDYSSIESNTMNKKPSRTNISDVDDDEEDDDQTDAASSNAPSIKQKSYEEIQQEKQKLLFNLERLQKQGYPPSKRYSMASSYEDMQFEYDRLKKQRDVEKSIKFSRKILMAVVSGVEFMNNRFDPFDVKLDGWSENVMENVNDYDEVFEELHDKYSDSVKMAPELKLLAMVAGSGFMFHLTNSLFKSASPKLSDILKQNPDIAKNISEAAAKNMGGAINQEFGSNDFLGNLMKGGINMKMNPQPAAGPARGPPSGEQSKMSGPQGIDDLLNELNNNTRDDTSVSSTGSVNIRSSAKRTVKGGKKGGIALDLR